MSREQATGYVPAEIFDATTAKRERADSKRHRVARTKRERLVEKEHRAARRSTRS